MAFKHLTLMFSVLHILMISAEDLTECKAGYNPCFKDCCQLHVQYCDERPYEKRCTNCQDVSDLCGTSSEPVGCGRYCCGQTTPSTPNATTPASTPFTSTTATTACPGTDGHFPPNAVIVIDVLTAVIVVLVLAILLLVRVFTRKRKAKQLKGGKEDPEEKELVSPSSETDRDRPAHPPRGSEGSPLLAEQDGRNSGRSSPTHSSAPSEEADATAMGIKREDLRDSDSAVSLVPESARDGGTPPGSRGNGQNSLRPSSDQGNAAGGNGPSPGRSNGRSDQPATSTNRYGALLPQVPRHSTSSGNIFSHDVSRTESGQSGSDLQSSVTIRPDDPQSGGHARSGPQPEQRNDNPNWRPTGLITTTDDGQFPNPRVVATGTGNPAANARGESTRPQTLVTAVPDTSD